MTAEEFNATLAAQGLTQAALSAEIKALTGHSLAKSTLSRMARGESGVHPFVAAYLILRGEKGADSKQGRATATSPDKSMKIKLIIPDVGLAAIKAMGLRQRPTETLRLVTDHPSSNHGLGVILRGKSSDILDGRTFAVLVDQFGAWIECDGPDTQRRVRNALVTVVTGTDDAVRVVPSE